MPLKVIGFEALISLMKDIQGGKTQEGFAKSLGVSNSYLSHIYSGRRDPSENLLLKMGVVTQTAYVISEETLNVQVAKQESGSTEKGKRKKKQGSR